MFVIYRGSPHYEDFGTSKNRHKMKNLNSSKKFMQIPLKVNKVYFFDIKHGLTMTFYKK